MRTVFQAGFAIVRYMPSFLPERSNTFPLIVVSPPKKFGRYCAVKVTSAKVPQGIFTFSAVKTVGCCKCEPVVIWKSHALPALKFSGRFTSMFALL